MTDETETNAEVVTNEQAQPTSPSQPVLGQAPKEGGWDIAGWLILLLGGGALLWGLIAAVGSGIGFWDWSLGLQWVRWSGYLALGVAALALLLGWRARKTGAKPPRLRRWLGTLMSVAYLAWLMTYVVAGWSVPDIHDVSTDLADPPEFRILAVRADNWDRIPGAEDGDMKGLTPRQRWTVIHQKNYGDIRSVRIGQPVADVIEKAERLAIDRGWDVVIADPAQGRLEATETSALFRFKEDIVVRVRPTEDGLGSLVDMRSVSRVGQNDQGTNAKRVRAFMADLSGTVSPR